MPGPWTRSVGWARTLLAIGTLLTLLCNDVPTLFGTPKGLLRDGQQPAWMLSANFFGMAAHRLEWMRWLAVVILAITASGWRPRVTTLPHWWVTWSVWTACVPVDGGDQISAVLTLLLIPVGVTDPRNSHWQRSPHDDEPAWQVRLASTALILCRIQVAAVYLHAAVGKLGVEEWRNGTAVWYWFLDPLIGVPRWAQDAVADALAPAVVVVGLTWGTIALEFALAFALVMPLQQRKPLLPVALLFHTGIVLVHGLVSFSLAMSAALVLLLVHPDDIATVPVFGGLVRGLHRWRAGARIPAPVKAKQEIVCRP